MKIMNWQQKLETKSVKDNNQSYPMKKIVLIVFCLCAVLSFSQELDTVKAIGNQTEEVAEFSEQNKQTPLLVAEVADESSPKK